MAFREYLAGEVAQDCADGLLSRREALRRLGLMGISAATAGTLLAACGGDDDDDDDATPAPTTAAATTDSSATTETTASAAPPTTTGGPVAAEAITFGELQGAWAEPHEPQGGLLVVHENRGLTPHFFDLVGRFANDGYAALAVDLLSFQGGTAALTDPAAAPAALAGRDLDALLADLQAGIDEIEARVPGVSVGTVGFCFGGLMVWSLLDAGEPRLAAAVPFYGTPPAEPDFSGSNAAVLAIYAGLDDRVNATRETAEAALQSAGLTYEIKTFDGVDHAFFNDTGERYNEAAATEAYALTLDWFGQHLA